MKSVRIFYTKKGRMKFSSHLDMNRLMTRILRRTDIPVWYTEGFNRHIYINYAVPLSLGFEGEYEVMDLKLTDEEFDISLIPEKLNAVAPMGLEFLRAADPLLPTKDIAFAEYKITFEDQNRSLISDLAEFLKKDSVLCLKKDKKGRMKEFDIIPKIKSASFGENTATLILSAGNEGNLNPSMVLSAFFQSIGKEPVFYSVMRTMIFNQNLEEFK